MSNDIIRAVSLTGFFNRSLVAVDMHAYIAFNGAKTR